MKTLSSLRTTRATLSFFSCRFAPQSRLKLCAGIDVIAGSAGAWAVCWQPAPPTTLVATADAANARDRRCFLTGAPRMRAYACLQDAMGEQRGSKDSIGAGLASNGAGGSDSPPIPPL